MLRATTKTITIIIGIGLGIYILLRILLAPEVVPGRRVFNVKPFSHVFIIVMENHGTRILTHNRNTPYIDHLMAVEGEDLKYDGVTHPSLPNYLALISGSTQGQFTDSPQTSFQGPTLVSQLQAHHKSWQAVMESIPYPGYSGAWYPNSTGSQSMAVPPNALYAKKHDPFAFFRSISPSNLTQHTLNLTAFRNELRHGPVPNLVLITPNLCHDMHGQPNHTGASCPTARSGLLERMGDQFLATWVPRIQRSSSWSGNAVIFILWDEANVPRNFSTIPSYFRGAPGTPRIVGIPLGGGRVPLIVIDRQVKNPRPVAIICNHYCVLKTIENSWNLGYLGATQNPAVKTLVPLIPRPHSSR